MPTLTTTQSQIEISTARTAIYIRCSSDEAKKEGYSPETQKEKVKDFIKLNNYHLDEKHIYSDIGFSGSTDKRPGLQRLLADAKNKEFDIIAVYRMDRFFRNLRLLLNTVAELREIGIEFRSATEPFDTSTPTGRAMFGNIGVFAEWMREVGMESRNEGMLKAMAAGKWLGEAPYGYKIKDHYLKRNPEEAKFVKMIYKWLVDEELSMYKIQQRLNSMKVPTRYDNRGKRKKVNREFWWAKRTIGRMLRNEVYSGSFTYRKLINPNRVAQPSNFRPEEGWIKIKTPAIISEDLFEMAQKQIDKNRDCSPRKTMIKYMFQHKISCGHDGRKWQSACRPQQGAWREVRYYFCSGTRPYATSEKCPSSSLAESKIAPVVWDELVKLLKCPKTAMKTIELYNLRQGQEEATKGQLEGILGLLKATEAQRDRLSKAYVLGGVDETKYKAGLERIKNEEVRLINEKQRLSQALISEEEKSRRIESIEGLYEKLKTRLDSADYDLKYLILQEMVKSIVIKNENMEIEFSLPEDDYSPGDVLSDGGRMD
ncbi:MAG: recombinase family protein [Patescibacteria group bacterium]